MMRTIIFFIVAAIILTTSCVPVANNTKTATPVIFTTEAAVTETLTPTKSPATIPEQGFKITIQCLGIQPSIPYDFESEGDIVLKDYYDNRTLFDIHPSSANASKTIFGEGFLYPFISPNKKMLAYLDISDVDAPKLKMVNIRNEIQVTIPWLDDWGYLAGWINDNQLYISPYGQEQMIVFDPFIENTKNIAFDQFPEFNFIPRDHWVEYDPTLNRVIYPKGGSLALFDVESSQVLAEVPTGVVRLPGDISWTINGDYVAVIGSIFPQTDNMGDELFIITRDGVSMQVTNLTNYYGKGISLSYPRWSPSGKRLAFWEMDSLNKYQDRKLLVVDLSAKQVTDYCISTSPDNYGNFGEALPAPIWSPDGTQLLVETRYSQDHSDVVLLDITKNIAIKIAENARPIGWMISP